LNFTDANDMTEAAKSAHDGSWGNAEGLWQDAQGKTSQKGSPRDAEPLVYALPT
jgi:hypothetical protein